MSGYGGYAYDNPTPNNGGGSGLGILDGGGFTGTPRNAFIPVGVPTRGGKMPSESTLRTLAFYLAVGAVTVFAVSKLGAIK